MKRFNLALLVVGIFLSGCAGLPGNGERIILYTALGASDAVGVGAFPLKNGYVFRIKDELEERSREVELINLGVPAAKIDTIKGALRIFLRAGIKPDLITIWTGANDIIDGEDPEDFESDLKRVLDQLREKTSAFILIADIPDLTQLPSFIDHPSKVVTLKRINAFNNAIKRQAGAFDVPIVKLSEEDINSELVSDIDGFHPSNKGHKMVAQLFLKIILPEFGLTD